MDLSSSCISPSVEAAFEEAFGSTFFPRHTIRSSGVAAFRSQLARDLGCLLDVDDAVDYWRCLPSVVETPSGLRVPDFSVAYLDGTRRYLDACDGKWQTPVVDLPLNGDVLYSAISKSDIEAGWRLRNAKDLLRYGSYETPLGDRIRMFMALDEVGSLTVAESFGLFQEIRPVAGLASLVLHRFISIDLDDELIGPDTRIERYKGASR
jgi:hypothetical protein